jgi:uncharacterized protein (DUF427 family)
MMTEQAATNHRSPGFAKNPDYRVDFEPSPRRVRVEFNGEIIADTTAAMLMRETRHTPVYYFPRADVKMAALQRTEHSSYCPFKGDASYWTIAVEGREAENAVWSYENPFEEKTEIKDYVSFYWGKVDHWYEEDEEIFVHPRDPHKRIDVVPSHRPVRVMLGGQQIAETTRAHFLFETGLPTRYYLPSDDVRTDLLEPSDTHTQCPYKGIASYWTAVVGSRRFEDIVWSYPQPIPECPKIKDYLCFFNEHVDAIFVDGAEIPRVETAWSKR